MRTNQIACVLLLLLSLTYQSSIASACPTGAVTLSGAVSTAQSVPTPTLPTSFDYLDAHSTASATTLIYDTASRAHMLYAYVFYLGGEFAALDIFASDAEVAGGGDQVVPRLLASSDLVLVSGILRAGLSEFSVTWKAGQSELPMEISLRVIAMTLTPPQSAMLMSQNGASEVCPRAGRLDFDGDGLDDAAIWRLTIGYWAVRLSSTQGATLLWTQWGLPGDYPMAGDYTGDGLTDLMIWRPTNGNWYLCPSEGSYNCSFGRVQQFGLPGDRPVQADYDGDDVVDYAVFRPSTGMFYYKSPRTELGGTYQWGWAADIPLSAASSR